MDDTGYHLRGNNNNYRLGDVWLGMRLADDAIVDLHTGRVNRTTARLDLIRAREQIGADA